MKYIAIGPKTITIHSDPSSKEEDLLNYIENGTKLDIIDSTPFYGYNDREYVFVKADHHYEGFILKELVKEEAVYG